MNGCFRQDTFKIDHATLEREWEGKDYDLIPIDHGFCDYCPIKEAKDKRVITQRGPTRYDVTIGCCFSCLEQEFKKDVKLEIVTEFETDPDHFHTILITCDGLDKLMHKTFGLKNDEQETIDKILNTPQIAKALKMSTIPFQCKTCLGARVEDRRLIHTNKLREQKIQTIFCFCCAANLDYYGDACSMISCPSCNLQASKTCVYCVNGAIEKNEDGSMVEHDLSVCSEKRRIAQSTGKSLPQIRLCKCEND
jgi:hypothetical protein